MIMLQRAGGAGAPSGSYGNSSAPSKPAGDDFIPASGAEELPTISQDEDVNVEGIPF
jgi:hypothetical protein